MTQTPEQIASEFQEDCEKAFRKATKKLVEKGFRRGATVLYTRPTPETKHVLASFELTVVDGYASLMLQVFHGTDCGSVDSLEASVADFIVLHPALTFEPDGGDEP